MGVLTELENRGLEDILIACADGLTGFPEAVRAVYPQTHVQLCIVRMVRNSTKFVSYQDLKGLCADLKKVYAAAAEQAGRDALDEFAQKWDSKYPLIYKSWDAHWNDLPEFFKYPEEVRKAVYTANAIEPLNFQLRKVTRSRLIFVNDDAVYKIMYSAIRNASEKWTMPIRHWGMALHQFAVMLGNERVPF
jgi:transposase-like protein